jgi:U3 small nucleolar RNA-associated protein 24
VTSSLFFQYNEALRPPYSVLVDTNFINFSIQKKLELVQAMMDCLYAKATPVITDCVMAELEKLGPRYRIALRIARDPRFERLRCDHKGTYADDCIVNRLLQCKIYIVATNDVDLVSVSLFFFFFWRRGPRKRRRLANVFFLSPMVETKN